MLDKTFHHELISLLTHCEPYNLRDKTPMRYFVPVPRLASELPPQSTPEDKLGGMPWGLPSHLWPTCLECGKSQSLLAQFVHHSARLDLGREGRILSVFQCNHDPGMCATWELNSGANACLITEPADLVDGPALLPEDAPVVELEARIVDWRERDDGVAADTVHQFFCAEEFDDLSEHEAAKPTWSTRLGGVPRWLQSPDEAPSDEWTFVGQLDSTYSFFEGSEAGAKAGVVEDAEQWEGRTHYAEGPNFGDGGIAYIFLRNTATKPEAAIFWQCG
jgi:hypothetical protein